jgi:hypothetical protein
MSLGVRAVHHVGLVVGVLLEFVQNLLEDAPLIPATEPNMNRLPRAEAFWQVPPWDAGLGDVEDRVHHRPVCQFHRPARPPFLGRQQRLDAAPLSIAQLVSVHQKLRSDFPTIVDPVFINDRPDSTFSGPAPGRV